MPEVWVAGGEQLTRRGAGKGVGGGGEWEQSQSEAG